MAPALEMVDTVEELTAAINDPEAFLKKLAEASGPAAKKLLIAQLHPKLTPLLEQHGLEWEDVVPAIETIDSVEELEA